MYNVIQTIILILFTNILGWWKVSEKLIVIHDKERIALLMLELLISIYAWRLCNNNYIGLDTLYIYILDQCDVKFCFFWF